MTDEPSICPSCKGRGTHLTKRDHPRGAGNVVMCSACDGTGVRTERRDERPRGSEKPVARFG